MSRTVVERLLAAGLELPVPAAALGAYVPAVHAGDLVFTSGQLPMCDGRLLERGLVGDTVSVEAAALCARQCALNALAAASTVCDLEGVERVVKLVGYVASAPHFSAQPAVIDGASEILALAFGEQGRHAREALGAAALPLGAPVEVSLVLELRRDDPRAGMGVSAPNSA
jgi:enamine deaminase RidA (YjgF/YER057c/UK114 family)